MLDLVGLVSREKSPLGNPHRSLLKRILEFEHGFFLPGAF